MTALDHFRNRQYAEALKMYLREWDELCSGAQMAPQAAPRPAPAPSPIKRKLTTLARIIECFCRVARENGGGTPFTPGGWTETLERINGFLGEYARLLKEAPPDDCAEHVVMDVFGQYFLFLFMPDAKNASPMKERAAMTDRVAEQLLAAGPERLGRTYAYERWMGAIEEFRRGGIGRPDLVEAVRAAGNVFVGNIARREDASAHAPFRASMDNLVADTIHFFQESGVSPENRWGEVERLLKDALAADSGNRFAREMLKHLYSVRNTSRQIRGFMHDLNNRTANLAALAGRLADMAAGVAGAGEIRAQIALETENIASITRLVNLEGEGMVAPPPKQQEHKDVADVLRDAGTSAGFPRVEIRTSGKPVSWGMWPALVRVAAINLLDNAREAHARKNLPFSGAPAWFEVDYDRRVVRCVDRAGGVAPGLRNALFEPYVSEKTVQVNVGLGLPQARLAMRAQRFDLRLDENQPPEGAAFVLDFNVPQPKGMPR